MGQPSAHVSLRIYDPGNRSVVAITLGDIVRRSVRTTRLQPGTLDLLLPLTDRGVVKYSRLTRELARRGARLGIPQFAVFEVNGRVYSRFTVDYRVSPNGLGSSRGIEFAALAPSIALRLRNEIRSG